MKFLITMLLVFNTVLIFSQEPDTVPYNSYRDKWVLYSDLGFSSAPFSIKGDFSDGINRVKYRHNQKIVLGFGFAYKWLAFRLGFALPGTLRPKSRFGSPNYQDLGLQFNIKQTYWDLDIRNYSGYVIKDANQWNDTLTAIDPNSKLPSTRSVSVSINSWYFQSKGFKMQSVLGKTGDFNQSHGTWYVKSTLNFFGSGDDFRPILPQQLVDTTINVYRGNAFSALDIGVVPGYAYVHRWNNWQASAFGGIGGVLQAKFFSAGPSSRGLLGLAPRFDLRLSVGYSVPKYFVWLQSNFDVKSIRFNDLTYRQAYNTLQIVAGVRLDKKKKKVREQIIIG